MSEDDELVMLRSRFEGLGYVVADRCYWGTHGFLVHTKPEWDETLGCDVFDASMFVYRDAGGWVLRLTAHGGRHWIRPGDFADIPAVVLEHLVRPRMPPEGDGWHEGS